MLDVQPGIIETGMTAPSIVSYVRRMKDGLTLFPRVEIRRKSVRS
ncbi:MAG: hypothetical protein OXF88_18440 [Rhodobacteraceae bacterium]|nr:hypothetical protein [Paracoccaceae bacterium]MCY4141788.1 hypothetical protein [Paracoccaceae bacterium]